jgi:hypothetical protein
MWLDLIDRPMSDGGLQPFARPVQLSNRRGGATLAFRLADVFERNRTERCCCRQL